MARDDNLYEELIRRVRAIKGSKNMDELRMIIMDTVEHSFQHSYDVIAEVNRWINKAEYSSGSNNIVLYLFERFKKNGEVSEDPIGMYDCIDNAIDYIKWSCRESRGARIELCEYSVLTKLPVQNYGNHDSGNRKLP